MALPLRVVFAQAPGESASRRPASASPPEADRPYPVQRTALTRSDPRALAALQAPGQVLFRDDFESEASFASYFEVSSRADGRASIVTDPKFVRTGNGALQLVAPDKKGESSDAHLCHWIGTGVDYERIHLRYLIRYAEDYDQGNLHHTGGNLAGVAGTNKWGGMGSAGLRPKGDDHFSSRLEGWRDWGRVSPPGFLHAYTYWMDMRIDKDGHYWGNMLKPPDDERFVPKRGQWICIEQMIKVNTVPVEHPDQPHPKPGSQSDANPAVNPDGELAAWVDGKLYLHYTGFRWRSTPSVMLQRATLTVYIHESRQPNTAHFDDFVISTGYIGPPPPNPR